MDDGLYFSDYETIGVCIEEDVIDINDEDED